MREAPLYHARALEQVAKRETPLRGTRLQKQRPPSSSLA